MADDAELRRLRTLYRLLAALSHAGALEDVYEPALTTIARHYRRYFVREGIRALLFGLGEQWPVRK